jgi:hypothetical protein
MATLDYNSVSGDVTFFPSNITYPVWFCDQNTGGIQIATRGAPVIPNTIQIGNVSSTLKLHGRVSFDSSVQVGNTTISSTEINISSQNKLTITENGINASGFDLNLQSGQLRVQGADIQSNTAGGINNEYLKIYVNGVLYKIGLHEA